MEKGIIIYKSKYGATAKYARWLGERTGFESIEASRTAADKAARCGTVVFCGGIYASGIAGLSFLKKNIGRLKGKRLAVLGVGASPYDEKAINELKARNLKDELSQIPLFYARGAWDEKSMKPADRMLCRLLQKAVAKKDPAEYEPWQKALMCAAGQSCDWTDEKYLKPLLGYLEKSEH